MKRSIVTALLATIAVLRAGDRVEFKYQGLDISAPKKYEKEIKEKLLPALNLKNIRNTSERYFNELASQMLKIYENNSEAMGIAWYDDFSLTKSNQEGLSACTKARPELIDILEVYKKCGKNLSRIDIWVPGAYMNEPNKSKVVFDDRKPQYQCKR